MFLRFAAIDDRTRLRILSLYPAHTPKGAVLFLTQTVLPGFSFPLQRVPTALQEWEVIS